MTASESALPFLEWPLKYREALVETDREKLSKRVAEAEVAIFERLQQLSQIQDEHGEHQAIQDAIRALRVIKRDRLNFPDWESRLNGS